MSCNDKKITLETLILAEKRAKKLGIKSVVVASSTGESALKAAEVFENSGINLNIVTDRAQVLLPVRTTEQAKIVYGKWLRTLVEKGITERKSGLLWRPEIIKELQEKGVKGVISGPEVFRGIRVLERHNVETIIAKTLKLFGIGTKVAVEITLMACDHGVINEGEEVISVAGSNEGLDTALVVKSSHSDDMFYPKKMFEIREIICKPRSPIATAKY